MSRPPSISMLGVPPAEVDITIDLARALLAVQHPDLADLPIAQAASGWDNVIFRLGEDLALRLPRRAVAVKLLVNEQCWLPLLASRLPLPIPAPVRIGAPQRGFPWPWSVTPWLKGETAEVAPPDETQGEALAAFFEALHRPAPPEAPYNPARGAPLAMRKEGFEARRASIAEPLPAEILALWADALAAPDDAAPVWLHGDPHPRNALVQDGRLSGIIDWGDLAKGDPASDLAGIWMLLPHLSARKRAMAALSAVSEATWRRARGWVASYGVVMISAGNVNDPGLAALGWTALERLLEGP